MGGVGVNFKPLFSKVFSVVLNFLLDKLIILMSFKSNRKAMNRNWSNQKANPALKTKAGNK